MSRPSPGGPLPAQISVLTVSFSCPVGHKSQLGGGPQGPGLHTPAVQPSEKRWAKSSNNSSKKMFLFWALSVDERFCPAQTDSSERFLFRNKNRLRHRVTVESHVGFRRNNALPRLRGRIKGSQRRVAGFHTLQRCQLVTLTSLVSSRHDQRGPLGCRESPSWSISPISAGRHASSSFFTLHRCFFLTGSDANQHTFMCV